MNIPVFLKSKYEENELQELLKTEDLYLDITNEYLKKLFAIMHQEFNRLYRFLNDKKKSNGHYNADESRMLIKYIKLYDDMHYTLKSTPLSFRMIDDYVNMATFCKTFLVASGGCDIPEDLPELQIVEYEPIFFMSQVTAVQTPTGDNIFQLKFIGEGSYAKVFKYKDEFYNKDFVIKRAKEDLDEKELMRFGREYETMKELKSPYVIEVYRYDTDKNQYYMEYADETIKSFIEKNNTKLSYSKRKGIARQILRGFSYIHSKGYLHRDISFTNILLQHYDNDLSIVKISDFGLVKWKYSDLTSFGSAIKGSLNDSNLQVIGFSNYSIEYETFALTRLIYYVMTGKYNLENIKDEKIKNFVLRGVNQDVNKRYKSINELMTAFEETFR